MRVRPWICISTVAAASTLAVCTTSFAGSNCCFANGGVGCDDPDCQATVCGVDTFCCNVAWDTICAGEAASLCAICATGTSNCCIANGGVGCDDPGCEATVCGVDTFCCNVAWDSICAGEAASLCGDLCSGGGGFPACPSANDCCFAGSGPGCSDETCCNTVCTQDTFCCNVAWDSICAGEAQSLCGLNCPSPCDNPNAGDCCSANGGIGCNDSDCCNTVCAADSFCCAVAWDGICASEAISLCAVCEGFGCGGASAGDCCSSHGTPFCNDLDCCNLVCSFDSFCCFVQWDSICASEANGVCSVCGAVPCDTSCPPGGVKENEPCGADTNGGCNTTSSASNCCIANGGVGCDDPDCQATVCGVDTFCCNVAWDGICAGEAASLCAICAVVPAYEPITAGVPVCGTFWADGSFRDTDWFSFSIVGSQNVEASLNANFPSALALLDKNCPPGIFVFNTSTTPCPLTASFCLAEGDYAVFVATSVFNGNPCGSGLNDYVLTLTVGPSCTPLSTCCFASGGLGCDDPDCQAAVCGQDSFCCNVAWDGICAAEAASLCAICAVPAPPNDECDGAIAIFDGVTPFSTAGATTSPPDLDPACERGFGLSLVDDIWYTYTATATGTVTVSLCNGTNYDSRIAAYNECGDTTVIACNDDFCGLVSEMSFDTVCGEDYILRIGGFSGSGSGNITITPTGKCPTACTGDLNGDGEVNAIDLGILLGAWGPCAGCPADLNGDGQVNAIDLGILLGAWGPCP